MNKVIVIFFTVVSLLQIITTINYLQKTRIEISSSLHSPKATRIHHKGTNTTQRPLFAIVSVLGTANHFEKDGFLATNMMCYAAYHDIPFHLETSSTSESFWDKQYAILKYLPKYEWIVYVDTDTFISPSIDLGKWLLSKSDKIHGIFIEISIDGRRLGIDAGVFAIRSSPVGEKIMNDWISMAGVDWYNADNGAFNIVMLQTILQNSYDGHCNKFLKRSHKLAHYHSFFDCYYTTLLGNDTIANDPSFEKKNIFSSGKVSTIPFEVNDWFHKKNLVSRQLELEPLIYHNKDIAERFNLDSGCSILRNKTETVPVFIHIPKTGGTSVEDALNKKNISVGMNTARNNQMPYTTVPIGMGPKIERMNQPTYCSPWHRPPSQFVPNSITIVREPKQRMVSEFLFSRAYHKKWFNQTFDNNCEGFNRWLEHIASFEANKKKIVQDCHLIPQYEYAKHAEKIIPFSSFHNGAWRILSYHFGVNIIPEVKNPSPNSNLTVGKLNCLSVTASDFLQDLVKVDYEKLSDYFD